MSLESLTFWLSNSTSLFFRLVRFARFAVRMWASCRLLNAEVPVEAHQCGSFQGPWIAPISKQDTTKKLLIGATFNVSKRIHQMSFCLQCQPPSRSPWRLTFGCSLPCRCEVHVAAHLWTSFQVPWMPPFPRGIRPEECLEALNSG